MKLRLLLFVLPMLGAECDGEEYTWHNQQYMHIRCRATQSADSVVVVRGRILDTTVIDNDRLVFVESACEAFSDWPTNTECTKSRITIFLHEGLEYDVTSWSEPSDRRTPVRTLTPIHYDWTCCDG